jgi:predicted nucleotidyltransferase
MKNKYTLDYIKNNNLIVLEAISGSHAYGLNIETSDIDKRGVFICELDDIKILNDELKRVNIELINLKSMLDDSDYN